MKKAIKKNLNHLTDQQFKALIENAHEGIILYDKKGKVKYSSNSVYHIAGYKEEEVLGKPGTKFLHKEDVAIARESFRAIQQKPGKSITLFQRIRHKKGHYIWSESRLTNFTHIPEINGVVSNFREITEKKQAEEKASKAHELLSTINRNLSEGIFMGILDAEFIYVNEAFLRLTGYGKFKDIKNINLSALFKDQAQRKKTIQLLQTKKTLKGVEALFKKRNGGEFWGVMNIQLLHHDGRADYFVGTLRDISKEREAEIQIIESKNFLDNVINTVAAPILVKDESFRWIMFNDNLLKLVGKTRRQVLGKTDEELLSKADSAGFRQADKEVLRTGKTVTKEEVITARGKVHNLLTVKTRYINEKGERFIIIFITDITHLKQAEAQIKNLHENLAGVLESSEESIFSVDQELCYVAFNRRHKTVMKMLYNADIAIGKNKVALIKHSPDYQWVKQELEKAQKGKHFVSEHYLDFPKYKGYIQTTYNPIRDGDGRLKGAAVFVQDITHRKNYERIINAINANLRALMESTSDGILAIDTDFTCIMFNNSYARGIKDVYGIKISIGVNFLELLPPLISKRVKTSALQAFKGKRLTIVNEHPDNLILETSYNPIYDDKGIVTGAAMFIRNVTEHTRMEKSLNSLNLELKEQNIQLATQEQELKFTLEELSERNFELDQLMYKTSHDLRAPLSSIMGLINLAHLDKDPIAQEQYLSKIEGRVKKLDEFIRSMLDYARVNRVEVVHEEIDLRELAKNVISELEYLENFKRVKTKVVCMGKGIFKSDKLRMKIIFSNIMSNAYKYINQDVDSYLKITIATKNNNLHLTFEDNGIGIKAEYTDKIFNMFYRATERSQGSGLGMYIVKQAVEKLKGKIHLDTEYGKGTKIEITLPK